jgi:hypothetical protein
MFRIGGIAGTVVSMYAGGLSVASTGGTAENSGKTGISESHSSVISGIVIPELSSVGKLTTNPEVFVLEPEALVPELEELDDVNPAKAYAPISTSEIDVSCGGRSTSSRSSAIVATMAAVTASTYPCRFTISSAMLYLLVVPG